MVIDSKTVELKEEAEEKVNGGFKKIGLYYIFDAGDCFQQNINGLLTQIKVKYSYQNVDMNTLIVCDEKRSKSGVNFGIMQKFFAADDEVFNKDNFIGNNIFDF